MFRMIFMTTGLRWLHSTDLGDMRNAILSEDDDGPDGGGIRPQSRHARQSSARVQ